MVCVDKKNTTPNSVLLKFWGFTVLASLLASVQFPAVEKSAFVNPQISEARCVICYAVRHPAIRGYRQCYQ